MAAEYTIKLDDEVSGPAKRAARGLGRIKSALGKVKGAARSAGGALTKVAGKLMSVAAAAGVAAAAAVAVLAVKLGHATVAAAAFMQQQEMAFGLLLKGSAKGGKALENIRSLAVKLGLPVKDTIVQFRKLLAMQFTPKGATDIVKMAADMRALGASATEVSSIIRAISQIKGKGVLQMEELQQQLAEAGVSVDLVIKQLSKATGKSAADVRKLISAGKVTADQGIAAIKAAVKAKLGISKLGDAARKATGTLGGMWGVFKAKAENSLLTIGQKLAPKLSTMFSSIMKGVGGIEFDEDQAVASFKKVIDAIKPALETTMAGMKDIFTGVFDGFDGAMESIQPVLDGIDSAMGDSSNRDAMISGFKTIGKVVGQSMAIVVAAVALGIAVVGAFAAVIGHMGDAADGIGDSLSGMGDTLSNAAGNLLGKAAGLGSSIITGIVSGIKSGASSVVSAITGVATTAINAAKSALGISSPSKVFAGIGQNVAAGMSAGMASGSAGVQASTRDMVSASTGAVSGGSQTTNNNRVSSSPSFNISGAQSPQETAEAVLRIQLDEARALLEQLGASMGASTQ